MQVGAYFGEGFGLVVGAFEAEEEPEGSTASSDSEPEGPLKRIQVVVTPIADIKSGILKIKSAFDPSDDTYLASKNYGTLITNKDTFEKFLNQFQGDFESTATGKYDKQLLKEAVDSYISLSDARNHAIFNYNALYLKLNRRQSRSLRRRRSWPRLKRSARRWPTPTCLPTSASCARR